MDFSLIPSVLTYARPARFKPVVAPNCREHETRALHLNRSWTGADPVQKLVQGREAEREWLPSRVSTFLTMAVQTGTLSLPLGTSGGRQAISCLIFLELSRSSLLTSRTKPRPHPTASRLVRFFFLHV